MNPATWNLYDNALYFYYPHWIVYSHWIAGIVFIFFCLYAARQTDTLLEYTAPLLFVVFAKGNMLGQLWYFAVLPAFCVTINHAKYRLILFILLLFFSFRELYSIFIGAVGYQNPPDAQS
ncbi:MAG: hypothetical protein IH820_18155, partial [Bacteroidetes bacterium]|nr:hypothetical protein [Bacteroidota bacterium]